MEESEKLQKQGEEPAFSAVACKNPARLLAPGSSSRGLAEPSSAAAAERRGRSRQTVRRQLTLPTCRLLAWKGLRQPAVNAAQRLCELSGRGTRSQATAGEPLQKQQQLQPIGDAVLWVRHARAGHSTQSGGGELAKVGPAGRSQSSAGGSCAPPASRGTQQLICCRLLLTLSLPHLEERQLGGV